jgi:hypothetical protein
MMASFLVVLTDQLALSLVMTVACAKEAHVAARTPIGTITGHQGRAHSRSWRLMRQRLPHDFLLFLKKAE